jgi:hypothetical protein
VFREIGLDGMVSDKDYERMPVKEFYKSQANVQQGRLFFTNMEVPGYKNPEKESMGKSQNNFRYTNTCCWVKGNNPFVVSNDNLQPKFNKTQTSFNYK